MPVKRKSPQRYVRIEGLTAWQLIRVLADTDPKSKIVVCQSPERGLLALVEHSRGPWIVEKGQPILLGESGR